ncbi:RNA-binding cell elongation regulator Jag/EloR [Abiotrophia defectiva]|uniref:RNA-binding cell elongation regulator Jag/EloR n=1 Tax=Abiotrophia defectiva TaxID=46125 RepID=UPI0028D5F230|nr:RNA-binding cell elongation regulator Jag/EloR [Abiotrophia defectiva]
MLDNSVTIKAPSVEQAVKIGLSKLKITEDQAVVTVINEGKKGLFGFGKQDAIVEISAKTKISLNDLAEETKEVEEAAVVAVESQTVAEPVVPIQEVSPLVEETVLVEETEEVVESEDKYETSVSLEAVARYLEDVIKAFGAEAKVSVEASSREVHFNIETDKSGLIIGKHGKIIDALQSLAQVMVHRGHHRRVAVLLNVGDYRDRRAGILESIADRTARQVLKTKQAVILDPLPAFERKQIHSHLSQIEHVKTHSEGVEPNRYLVVEYEN